MNNKVHSSSKLPFNADITESKPTFSFFIHAPTSKRLKIKEFKILVKTFKNSQNVFNF